MREFPNVDNLIRGGAASPELKALRSQYLALRAWVQAQGPSEWNVVLRIEEDSSDNRIESDQTRSTSAEVRRASYEDLLSFVKCCASDGDSWAKDLLNPNRARIQKLEAELAQLKKEGS